MIRSTIFLVLVVYTLMNAHNIASAQMKYQDLTSSVEQFSGIAADSENSVMQSSFSSILTPLSQDNKTVEKIPNQYIIVLKDNATTTPLQAAKEATDKGAQVLQVYRFALKGFVVKVPDEKVLEAIVENNPDIDYVNPDVPIRALGHNYPRTPEP